MAGSAHQSKLESLFDQIIKEGASDLHLNEGRRPVMRVSGALIPLVNREPLSKEEAEGFLNEFLTADRKQKFLEEKEVDFSYRFKDGSRFRGNGFFEQGSLGFALRLVPQKIRSFGELNLPESLAEFTRKEQGFFLVVGPVGQGKSTTLAAMIELINQTRAEHIMTIEDPIEYVYTEKLSTIDQREVRLDTKHFHTALSSVFRQDINVLLIGEMRDMETISAAVTAAETGHLVFSTLHTNDASQTIERIIDVFPAAQQDQIRVQLASSLTGIFSQRLIPRISGGLVPAYELLINNSAVGNLIREKRTHELNSVIETGLEQGMIDMNRSLADLVRRGEITPEDAYGRSLNPSILERMI